MIKIGILDIKNTDEEIILSLAENSAELSALSNVKNKKRRAESIIARLLIKKLYSEISKNEMPKIEYSEKGKPFFTYADAEKEDITTRVKKNAKINNCFLSISHDSNLIAAAISDTSPIGIDLQSMPQSLHSKEKIEERLTSFVRDSDYYFSRAGVDEDIGEFEIIRYEISCIDTLVIKRVGCVTLLESEETSLSSEDAEFLFLWTNLEALLKMSGDGFFGIGRIRELLSIAHIRGGFLTDKCGQNYSFTIAAEALG